MKVIECSNVVKTYGRNQVLNEMSFVIEENKITGLIGRNGVGKTSLLKILSGFIRPTSGIVKVLSHNPYNHLEVSANSILVDDQMTFPPAFKLKDILEEGERFYQNWNRELANGLLNYFSLNPNQYHQNLSKGQTSTFNLIFGLATRATVTLFDEPTTGMDEGVRKDVYRAILKDYLAFPRTMVISSHHLNEIEDLLEDVMLVNNGKVLLHLPITELKEYAIALKGRSELVTACVLEKDVIFQRTAGIDQLYAVIKNEISVDEQMELKKRGIEVVPVSASDICVYLTNKQKGGIDDVFRQSKLD